MRWRSRHATEPGDLESKEQAKLQAEIAKAIQENAEILAQEHRDILRRNNLGIKVHRALGGR